MLKRQLNKLMNLDEAGADIVRVSCPDQDSSLSLKKIIKTCKRTYSS